VSVAYASPALIRIELPAAEHAGGLVQALVGVFYAEDIALDGDRLEVELRPLGDADAAVARALETVEAWLATEGLDSTTVHVFGHSYRLAAPQAGSAGR